MFIIVGLGNPGRKYQGTRHNVGFDTIDYIARKHDIKVNKLKHQALIGEGHIAGQRVILVKPQTYMNLSGQSVASLLRYYKVNHSQLFVVYDDIDIAVGALRIRKKGSAGTHNGMRNIIYLLKRDDFPRFRIGIGRSDVMALRDFVLTRYQTDEVPLMEAAIMRCERAIVSALSDGLDKAMSSYNGQ